ncbi:sulfite exporter TauE/SafE family protein [Canibacter zhoujuaniae]|uniref:sulfite exporter TauE/SafE family protein n=1 Tax=Canibacter zhoujuaniae TaxID=2708343 RepID=UPI0014232466|nr:sulfite exporter TauE/SafE family protein [Canibacter zhoujuaniae]
MNTVAADSMPGKWGRYGGGANSLGALWPYLVVGAISGAISGVFGLGGGVVIVPLLVFLFHFNQRQASATSALALAPIALSGVTSFAYHGSVHWIGGITLAAGIFFGARLGVKLQQKLSLLALEIVFLVFIAVSAVMLWVFIPDRSSHFELHWWVLVLLAVSGFTAGIATGLLGIGGGVIVVPLLIVGFGMSDILAKGTSLLMAFVGAIAATQKQFKSGNVQFGPAIAIGVSAAATAPFGAWIAVSIDPFTANVLFSVFLALIAVQYCLRIRKDVKAKKLADRGESVEA